MTITSFGIHAVLSVLENSPNRVDEVFLQNNYKKNRKLLQIAELLEKEAIPYQIVSKAHLDQLTANNNHQGVALSQKKPKEKLTEQDLLALIEKIKTPVFLLILDQIQDPHNLGACLRTAVAAGVDAVIAPKDGSAPVTAVVQKISCGATEIIPYVQVTNLSRTIEKLQAQGIWVTGTDVNTDKYLYDVDYTGDIALVIGSEGKGLRRLVKQHCDYLVKIPMSEAMESLNASVATGICLFEVVRQRTRS